LLVEFCKFHGGILKVWRRIFAAIRIACPDYLKILLFHS
jgi:hypothetical protein